MVVVISKSPTADTRTCDWSKVDKETLLESSRRHRGDVEQGVKEFVFELYAAARMHDFDKITDIDGFHRDFATGFKSTEWLDEHRRISRHHLDVDAGVPEDVNLIDVIEYIIDCVMAGMARSGSVYELKLSDKVLRRAFDNTVEWLKDRVLVKD